MKPLSLILGFLSAALILAQLTMGQIIVGGHDPKIIKMHQHTGYLTVAVSLVYIVISMVAIASLPKKEKP
jgi:tetrahydromethanopterin S-methyltransferase subunit D